MTALTPEQQLAEAIRLIERAVGAEVPGDPMANVLRDCRAFLAAVRPDPVKVLDTHFSPFAGVAWPEASTAWQTLRARLAALDVDEKAIREDEARLCAKALADPFWRAGVLTNERQSMADDYAAAIRAGRHRPGKTEGSP